MATSEVLVTSVTYSAVFLLFDQLELDDQLAEYYFYRVEYINWRQCNAGFACNPSQHEWPVC